MRRFFNHVPVGIAVAPNVKTMKPHNALSQFAKLLPVEYFMVTFTLPYELRCLAWHNQTAVYNILFDCTATTLQDFGLNPDHLRADIGMTAVLHTHSRRLDYHPHCHVIVPGGGIDKLRRQWKKAKGKYLFNEFALAKVFRARCLESFHKAGLTIPLGVPKQWVVDCAHVGHGKPALKYLSHYLYRGVISENAIVSVQDGLVTFQYTDSKTGKEQTRTPNGEDFCWLVLQHVLPKGFRRIRDYGFLHGNAKQTLKLVQLVLRVVVAIITPRARPVFNYRHCQSPLNIIGFIQPNWQPG
ncbi:MAG: IS91 family transposase [Methylococcales bacterium]